MLSLQVEVKILISNPSRDQKETNRVGSLGSVRKETGEHRESKKKPLSFGLSFFPLAGILTVLCISTFVSSVLCERLSFVRFPALIFASLCVWVGVISCVFKKGDVFVFLSAITVVKRNKGERCLFYLCCTEVMTQDWDFDISPGVKRTKELCGI
ncbi:hypothetical protein CEXT_806691 [Caerostris extrusa]|uniref:Transmembrane protein n=1 Tax=Caerostris extrusa TaxID=172846 RepID=A0AAV4M658_CAEEX|nr:hypothetical protein CEXT_806691 [Caerostris extrusa]